VYRASSAPRRSLPQAKVSHYFLRVVYRLPDINALSIRHKEAEVRHRKRACATAASAPFAPHPPPRSEAPDARQLRARFGIN